MSCCLGVLYFEKADKSKHIQVELDDLEDHKQKLIVVGQILDLVFQNSYWIWNGHYIRFGANSSSDPSTSRQNVIRVPGALVYPIAPDLRSPEMDSEDDICMWTIGHEQLEEVLQLAWADLDPDSEDIISNVSMLPAITKVNLPYKKEHGMQFFQLKFKVADFLLKMMCPS
jgi:hypothetical protein